MNTKSSFFPPKFPKPQARVNTTFSKTPFFLKNPVGFPSTPAFSYQTPLRCGKLGKFPFYDDLWALFYPFFKTCSRNPPFSRFSPDFTPLFPVFLPFFYPWNLHFSEKPRSTIRTSPPPFPPENPLFSSNYFNFWPEIPKTLKTPIPCPTPPYTLLIPYPHTLPWHPIYQGRTPSKPLKIPRNPHKPPKNPHKNPHLPPPSPAPIPYHF